MCDNCPIKDNKEYAAMCDACKPFADELDTIFNKYLSVFKEISDTLKSIDKY
jgi:hypothetical protein